MRLVSLNYGREADWKGSPPMDRRTAAALATLIRARNAAPGRLARVHNAPANPAIYRALLDAGVDLIGTTDIEATRRLLTGLRRD